MPIKKDTATWGGTGDAVVGRGPGQLRLLVALTLAVAGAVAAFALSIAVHQPVPPVWRIALVCGLVAGSGLAVLQLRFRGTVLHFDWSEGALLVGLVFLPPTWLVILAPFSAMATGMLLRKGPVRTLFNAAVLTIASAAAGWLATAVCRVDSSDLSWTLLAALCLAGLVFTVVACVATCAAIALSQNQPFLRTLRAGLWLDLLTGVGNVGAALVVVAVISFDPWLLVTLPMLVIALHLTYHSRLRARQERETWTRLEHTTRAFTKLDPAAVAEAAIDGILELFQADRVEVLFRRPDGSDARYDGGRGDPRGDGQSGLEGGPAVTVPLGQPEEGLGSITLYFGEKVTLNAREHHALATLATALAVALANAERYEVTRGFAEAKARQLLTDPVTELGNRARLVESGTEQLLDASARDVDQAMLLVDLGNFKEVNDTLGHDTGDRLLVEVARRLTSVLAADDLVVRLGSHEFAILAPTADRPPPDICARLITILDQPMIVDGLHINAPASIGISCYPTDAQDIRDLLRFADAALVRAKRATERYARYDADQDHPQADRLLIVEEARAGIDNGDFVLHYQPKVDLDTGEIRGVEALIRWQHPNRGLLSPGTFLPAIEQSALVHEFTHRILDMAMSNCATWLNQDPRHTLAVNLSARNLLNLNLPDDVLGLLKQHHMPARQLVLEVTETAMMSDLDTVDKVLARLRDTGVRLSLDDFGTGYSSLAVLSRIAVDEVKIDRSFVSRMLTSPRDDVVVRGTLSLANGLGLGVVAEGVETKAEHDRLQALGCQTAQGYYYSPPVPIDKLHLLPRQLPATSAIPAPRSPSPSHVPGSVARS